MRLGVSRVTGHGVRIDGRDRSFAARSSPMSYVLSLVADDRLNCRKRSTSATVDSCDRPL